MKGGGETSYEVMLGYPCNLLCRFCSQELDWRGAGWLPLAAARDQIYLAYQRGCRTLNLLGGEVTVYPDVLALLAFGKKLGFTVIQFETNGVRLADRDFARDLAGAGLTRVSVSVHAGEAKTHDSLVKASGAFAKLLKGMDHMRELGVDVRVTYVLNKANYRDLEAFCRFFAREKKVTEFQFIYPLYTGDFKNYLEELAVPMAEVLPYLERGFEVLKEEGCRPPNVHNVPPCMLPGRLEQLGDWQDLGMEMLKPDGQQYRETRETPMYRKTYAAACEGCSMRQRCVGIDPEYLRRWGESEIRPYPGSVSA